MSPALQPVSVALLPTESSEIIRLLRAEYSRAIARDSRVQISFYDRLLEKLGDSQPIRPAASD